MAEQVQDAEREQGEELAPQQNAQVKEGAAREAQEEVRADDRSHFFAVANSIIGAIHWQSPHLMLHDRLSRRESDAIRLLYEARTAQESEYGGGSISGLERMKYLNEGLIALQGVMAMGKAIPQARSHIEEIRRLIAKLKEQVSAAIVAEERRKQEEKAKKDLETKKNEEEANAKKKAEAETKKG
jgi:hypothetical protein